MATIITAREAIYDHFLTNYVALPSARIDADNEDFTPPTEQSWARLSVRHLGSVQESLGGVGFRKFDRFGSCFVQIFIPLNDGVSEADTLAQAVITLLEGTSLSGNTIRFTNSQIRELGVENGWYVLVVETFFSYTETK